MDSSTFAIKLPANPSTMTPSNLTIKQTSELTGLSPSVLRIWELRYGWPKPERKSNKYRTYKAAIIKDLKWVAARIADGKTIRDLISEGKLVRDDPPRKVRVAEKVTFDFSAIPLPKSAEGRNLRERLEQAIRAGDHGQIALVRSQAARLRPSEREVAVDAVLRVTMTKK